MKSKAKDFKQYYFVIRQLVSREIKRKYARSYLGILWSVLNPLLSMAVLSMIFTTIFKRSIENFPIYYLTGIIIWQMFSGATNAAMTSLVDNRSLLIKLKLPKQIFALARVYTALVNFGYTFIAYVLMLLLFRIPASPVMLLFPIVIFFTLLFSMGIGYFLSIAYVFFADIKYLYSVLLTLWMYCSAIFYPVDQTSETMQRFIRENPVYNYIACARECMMYGKVPDLGQWVRMVLWGAASFLLGYLFFRKKQNMVMQKI